MPTRRTLRRGLAPLVVAGLALTASACGSGGSGGSGSSDDTGAKYNQMSSSDLAKAAKKEGSITWYTTFSDDDVQPMVKAFNKVYPGIKVNALRLSADKIPPRVITEQRGGKYNADVVSGDSPQIAQLLHAKALQSYTPPDAAPLPSGLSLPKGYEGVVYAVTTTIAYNPSVLKKKGMAVPDTWEALTAPQWKGKFSIDPEAINWYDSLIKSMGHDKALALVKKLGANKPVFVESHTQALTQVQAGEPAVTATSYGYKASDLKKETPKEVEFINAKPLPSSLNLVDVVKHAPHPAAARLFDDWMVSKEGQQAIVSITNHTSLRPDVKNDTAVWDESKWPPAWGNPTLSPDEYNSELSEYKSALNAP